MVVTTDPVGPSPAVRNEQTDLYSERALAMRRLAYLLVGSNAVADELVHDAFEQVVRRWDDIDQPAAYLRVAVINGARSWGRRRRTLPIPPDDHGPVLDAEAIAVRDALAELRHPEREAIVLRFYAGLTDTQIAEHTDQPVGTVKSKIHRGLARLRADLKDPQ